MTWPIDTIVRTISGTFLSSTIVPKTGMITFTPTTDVTTSAGVSVIAKTPILIALDSTGSFSVVLPVSDNELLVPALWAYDITINIYGSKPIKTRIVLVFGDGSVIDLPSQLLITTVTVPIGADEESDESSDTVSIAVSTPARGPIGLTGNPGLIPVFSRQNELSVLSSGMRFYFDTTRIIDSARASVGTPSTGSSVIVGVRINGTSIGTVSIAAGTNTAVTFLNHAVNAGDYTTIDILSVGSTTSGSDLSVILSID